MSALLDPCAVLCCAVAQSKDNALFALTTVVQDARFFGSSFESDCRNTLSRLKEILADEKESGRAADSLATAAAAVATTGAAGAATGAEDDTEPGSAAAAAPAESKAGGGSGKLRLTTRRIEYSALPAVDERLIHTYMLRFAADKLIPKPPPRPAAASAGGPAEAKS